MSQDFNELNPWGNLARCVVNPDHTVAYFLDPDDSDLDADSNEVNWATVESNVQNVMVQIPKFYYVKKKVNETFIFGVTDEPVETDYVGEDEWEVHPAFFRDRTKLCDDTSAIPVEVDYRYVGAFHGWVDGSGRLRSLPGKMPTAEKNIGEFRDYSKQMGAGWCQFDFNLMYAIQMLYITEYGHPDSQTMIGRGYVDGNSAAVQTGATMGKGNATFGETEGKTQMSYRGIEDLWGNVYNWVDGFYVDASGNILVGNKGFNNTGSGYVNVGKESSSISGANIRHIQNNPEAGFIPRITSGTSYDEGLYDFGQLGVASGGRFARYGSYWSFASSAGVFYFYANSSASYSSASIGARLCA